MKRTIRHLTIATSWLAGALSFIALDGCSFDDRDLAGDVDELNSCRLAFNDICNSTCPAGTDTYDCTEADPGGGGGDGDTCTFANDGECDEPDLCEVGTDTSDCVDLGPNSCNWAFDDVCDEPDLCPAGTDTADCGGVDPSNSCEFPYDGICDEPNFCEEGTDSADCFWATPDDWCENVDGFCDEGELCPFGSDTTDCSGGFGDDSCDPYALDGFCDEGTLCAWGTDNTDCTTFTAYTACNYAGHAVERISEECFGTPVIPDNCFSASSDEILDTFVCANELLTVSCEEFAAGEGTPVCDELVNSGLVTFVE